jgi:hypothetical protein
MFRHANGAFFLTFVALALFAGPGWAEPQNSRTVVSEGGLRLRNGPDPKAGIIAVIPDGTEVQILEEKPEVTAISGVSGKWTKVWTANQGEGWVFGGYLFDSRSLLKTLAASYDSIMAAEPGDAPAWLTIKESVICSGYGGSVEANWYCMVSKVSKQDNVYTVEGNTAIAPTPDDIQWLARNAESKIMIRITAESPGTISIDNETFRKRR